MNSNLRYSKSQDDENPIKDISLPKINMNKNEKFNQHQKFEVKSPFIKKNLKRNNKKEKITLNPINSH